ncbi:MAG TPA: GIY-YIG nuclease family protein, partial [Dehalococcoidia bacterium]
NAALDTEELAVRLLPDLKRPSLGRVATALGLAQPVRHRALADARLTAQVLLALLPRAGAEGIDTFASLQAWLSTRLAARQERVRRVRSVLPAGALRDLPEAPGVYCFHDAQGTVLYVGKAAALRTRVAQHFSGASLAARHHEALLDRTVAVTHEVVECELDALLLESARIRALRPPYNVLERSRRGCPFLRLEAGVFPRFSAATAIADDGAEYFGPYRTTQDVQHLMATLRRVFQIRSCRRRLPATRPAMRLPCARLDQRLCPAPCADLITPDQYAVLVTLARSYARSGKLAAIQAVEAAMAAPKAATTTMRPLLEEINRRLRRVRRDVFPIDGGRAGGTVLMGYPAASGGLRLFLLRDGHLLARKTVHGVGDALAAACLGDPAAAERDNALDADQTNILLRWLHRHLGQPQVLALPASVGPAAVAAFIEEQLARSQPFEEADVEAEIVDAGQALGGNVFHLEEVP